MSIPTFSYHIAWRSRSHHAGSHRGAQGGLGMEFRGNVPLSDYPDARRIDLRESLRDPMEQLQVRTFNQKTPTPVFAACDLSGSMGFGGHRNKMALAADIAASIAASATEYGDRFGLIGFADALPDAWQSPASVHMHEALEKIATMRTHQPDAPSADGLQEIAGALGSERALVFLISDFHIPLESLEAALNTLSRHQVVPLVLWDEAEYWLPRAGIGTIVDPETGTRRTLFFRQALRTRFEQAFAERRDRLEALFLKCEMPPVFIEGAFDPAALTDYFHRFSAP